MRKPLLVVIDSCNLSGKSTVADKLKNRLLEKGLVVKSLYQPFYKENRDILLSSEDMHYKEEYKLFKQDRLSLYHNQVVSSSVNVIIMCRSIVSSLVYQAMLHGDYDMEVEINKDASKMFNEFDIRIDIGVNLVCSPKIIAKRNQNSDGEYDYRDTDEIDVIKNEMVKYMTAWNNITSLGLVKDYQIYSNNNEDEMDELLDDLTDKVIYHYTKKE